jgi:hypothetical protein
MIGGVSSAGTSACISIQGQHSPILIEQCQGESVSSTLLVSSSLTNYPITLLSNHFDAPSTISGVHNIVGMGNYHAATLTLSAPNATYTDIGDRFGVSGSIVKSGSNSIYRQLSAGSIPVFENGVKFGGSSSLNALSTVWWNNVLVTFPAIAAGATSEQTIPLTGVTAGMAVSVSPNSGLETGLMFSAYAVNNGIVLRLYNSTASSITPSARQWKGFGFA